MEKDRSTKLIAIVALLIAVAGLTIGFAAMSSTLIIKSSAEVKANENDFDVELSTNSTEVETDNVTKTVSEGATAEDAIMNSNARTSTIENIKATFTSPNQSVTYSFYSFNKGRIKAYLNSIEFENITDSFKVCTPNTNTNKELVDAACENINLTLKVGDTNNLITTSESINDINGHSLEIGSGEPIVLTITYTGDKVADGDFQVSFGDISLKYDSAD